jgi:hypothetical protein
MILSRNRRSKAVLGVSTVFDSIGEFLTGVQ